MNKQNEKNPTVESDHKVLAIMSLFQIFTWFSCSGSREDGYRRPLQIQGHMLELQINIQHYISLTTAQWSLFMLIITFVYASFMKARLASVDSRNSTIAVRPDGGSSTLPRDPWGENRASSSSGCTPEGKFFTRITELLRWPDAYTQTRTFIQNY